MRPGEHTAYIDENIYKRPRSFYVLISLIAFGAFALGILINFSFEGLLLAQIESALSSQRNCKINYQNISLSYFLPALMLKSVDVSGPCLGEKSIPLHLERVDLSVYWPSLFPPGPRFKIDLSQGKTHLYFYPSLSFRSAAVKIEGQKIQSDLINQLFNGTFSISGDFDIEGHFTTDYNFVGPSNLAIISKNLALPSQNIAGLNINLLNLKNLSLKATINDSATLTIQEAILGSPHADIFASFTGEIALNKKYIDRSKVALEGKIKFSPKFLKDFAIISLFLGSAKMDKNGLYSLRLKGNLGNNLVPEFL